MHCSPLRFASVWDVPVFSTGGMQDTFRMKAKEYKSLTCLGPTHRTTL